MRFATIVFMLKLLFRILFVSIIGLPWAHAQTCGTLLEQELAPLAYMLPQYRGENQGLYTDPSTGNTWNVTYYDDEQLKSYEVKVVDGKLIGSDGYPFDSGKDEFYDGPKSHIFVIDQYLRLYISRRSQAGLIHHSSLSRGEPVVFSGKIAVLDGIVKYLSDNSGHYRISKNHVLGGLRTLDAFGLNMDQMILSGFVIKEEFNKYDLEPEEVKRFLRNGSL